MKKIIIVVSCLLVCFELCGCKNTIKKSGFNYLEVETTNQEYDKELIKKADEIYREYIAKAKSDGEKHVVTVKYIDDIYKIASNRVNLDLEILNVFSDLYKEYVESLKSYCEIYLTERGQLVKNDSLINKEIMLKTQTGVSLTKLLNLI